MLYFNLLFEKSFQFSRFLVLYSSGMQQIYDQIQKRLEDRNMQDEMKNYEREQIQEKQEKMNLEDFKVRHTQRKHTQTLKTRTLTVHLTGCVFPGPGEEEGGATASAGGEHAHQC